MATCQFLNLLRPKRRRFDFSCAQTFRGLQSAGNNALAGVTMLRVRALASSFVLLAGKNITIQTLNLTIFILLDSGFWILKSGCFHRWIQTRLYLHFCDTRACFVWWKWPYLEVRIEANFYMFNWYTWSFLHNYFWGLFYVLVVLINPGIKIRVFEFVFCPNFLECNGNGTALFSIGWYW